MNYGKTLVNISKSVVKTSLILLIISSGLMIYIAINAEPSLNQHTVNPGQTITTSRIYREAGDKFQIYVFGDFENDVYDDNETPLKLRIVIYQAQSLDMSDAVVYAESTSNKMNKQIELLQDSYFQVSITNLSDRPARILSGNAYANMGLIVAFVVAAVVFAISVAIIATAFSLVVTGLVLFALVYPFYLLGKQDRQKNRQIYYPKGYNPSTRSQDTQGNNVY